MKPAAPRSLTVLKWLITLCAVILIVGYLVFLRAHRGLYIQSGLLNIHAGEYHFSYQLDGIFCLEWLGAIMFFIIYGIEFRGRPPIHEIKAYREEHAYRFARAISVCLVTTGLVLFMWSAWVGRVLRIGEELYLAIAIGALAGWLLTMRDGPGLWLAKLGCTAARIPTWVLLIASFCMGAAVCAASWLWIFERQEIMTDAQSQISQARLLLTGHFIYPVNQALRDVIEIPYALLRVPSYSQYPPGHILLLLPVIAAGLPAQTLSFVAGGVMVACSALIAARLAGRAAGVAIAIMLAGSPFFAILGGTAMNHMTCAALVMVTICCWLPLVENNGVSGGRWRAMVGGLALGWIVCTRPLTGLAHGLIWGIALLAIWIAAIRSGSPASRKYSWRLTLWGAFGLAIPAAVFIFYNLQTTGVPLRMAYSTSNPTGHVLGFRSTGPVPYSPLDAIHHTAASLISMNKLMLGWAIGSWTALLVWWKRTRLSRAELLLASLIVSQFILYGLYHFFDLNLGPRFVFEILGPLAILAAIGIGPALRHEGGAVGATLLILACFAIGGLGTTFMSEERHFVPTVYSNQKLEAFMSSIEPRRRPTVVLIKAPYNEMVSRWYPAVGNEQPIYFVLKSKEKIARELPELRGFDWVEFK